MHVARVRRAVGASLLALVMLSAGCTERRPTADVGPLPVAPTAYPTGPASVGPGVAGISEDIQALTIHIEDGRFESDVYDLQLRPVRLEVWASDGGAYTLTIDGLVQSQPLDADGTTLIALSPTSAGEYTMRLSGAGTDTATLNVRGAGNR